MIEKHQALEFLLEDWEKEHDEPAIVSIVHKGPARNHRVRKARDKSLQMVATFIRKLQLNDDRSREILRRAEQVQGKTHHKPKRPNRPDRRFDAESRVFNLGDMEPYTDPVRSSGDIRPYIVTPEVPDSRSKPKYISVPCVQTMHRDKSGGVEKDIHKINSTT